jgi:flagella synthesis protein FlgN
MSKIYLAQKQVTDSTTSWANSELTSRLTEERVALHAFVSILEKEQQALLDRDSDLLISLAELKSQSANQLTSLVQARRQLLNTNQADTTEWLKQFAPSALIIWNEIQELAKRAHHLNQVNGEVIQLKLRSNHQALSALLNAAKSASGLYGRDGQPNLAISGRILGSG